MTTSLDKLGETLAHALVPLGEMAGQPDTVARSLASLGFAPPPGIDLGTVLTLDATSVVEKLKILLRSTPEEQEDSSLMAGRAADLVLAVAELIDGIRQFVDALPTTLAAAGDYVTETEITKELPRRLLDLLVVSAVGQVSPTAAFVLRTLGIFGYDLYGAGPSIYQVAHRRTVIRYERLEDLFSDPRELFVAEYGWGTASFDAEPLLTNLGLLVQSLGMRPLVRDMPQAVEEALAGQPMPGAVGDPSPQLLLPITTRGAAVPVDASLSLHRLRPTAVNSSDAGLELVALVAGDAGVSIPISTNLALRLDASLDLGAGVGIALRPTGAEFRTGFLSGGMPGTAASGRLGIGLHRQRADGKPSQILTVPGGTVVEADDIFFEVGCALAVGESPDPYVLAAVVGGHIVITLGGADGFLSKVLPGGGIESRFDVKARWSQTHGLRFEGSGMLEIAIPVHETLGPFRLDIVTLGLGTMTGGLRLTVALTGGIALGPLQVTIEKIGIRGDLKFVQGNLGNADLSLDFKPPDGAGFLIDASAVVGGGYLYFDNDKGQYGGVLQLEVKGGIAIKAIGLISTKMPDGSPGFSLLVIISVEFSPIALGYGFTLNGVGGLAGFNRTMKVDALRDGIKNRTLDSIMFPPDPINNAPKIISDLGAVFPPAPGRFVFGPMVELGWGSGILILAIGVVVELPSPLRLAILGRLHLKLPPLKQGGEEGESKNLVEIHMDVLGILDFDRGEASIDAILYDSRLVLFPITGGMAMRLRWGNDPIFMLSIGGFNPRYTPPPGFPLLDRLGLQLNYDKDGVRAQLRLVTYIAVTPNSLQFGARIDAYAEVSVAKISGYLGFDALIEFHPFHFIVDLYGGVAVKAFSFSFSVDLLLTLSGPEPFIGDGHVTINFLGKHEVAVHFSIGAEDTTPALPAVDPLPELLEALSDLRNWSAVLPSGGSMLVTLRQLDPLEMKDKVLAHPLGELTVRQKVLPLGITLERFGASVPTTPGPFNLGAFTLENESVGAALDVRDAFAPGQFVNLSEDEKVSRPSFESFNCGKSRIGTDAVRFKPEAEQTATFEYDVTIIDNKEENKKRKLPNKASISGGAFTRAAQFGAAKQTPMVATGSAKFAGTAQGIKVRQPEYAIAGLDDMKVSGTDSFRTYTEAEAARGDEPAGESQVVEAYEIGLAGA